MPSKRSSRRNAGKDTVSEEVILFAKAATNQFKAQVQELEGRKNSHIAMIRSLVEYSKAQLPSSVLHVPLSELRATKPSSVRKSFVSNSSMQSSGCQAHFVKPEVPGSTTQKRRSSSYDSFFNGGKKKKGTFQTPGISVPHCSAITPKMNPDSPVGMLRIPQPGEFAISASGSPLLVSTSACSDSANLNIPLRNGKIMSILPKPSVNTDTIADNLDPEIRRQLETLTNTLNAILRGNMN